MIFIFFFEITSYKITFQNRNCFLLNEILIFFRGNYRQKNKNYFCGKIFQFFFFQIIKIKEPKK